MKFLNVKKVLSAVSIVVIALIFSVGVSYVFAWTAPPGAPTFCPIGTTGCDAPVNVGPSHQNKLGSLSLNTTSSSPDAYGLDVFGISRFFGNVEIGTVAAPKKIKITDGNQADGKVLTSDANGLATWKTSTGGSGALSFYTRTGVSTYDSGSLQATAWCDPGDVVVGGGYNQGPTFGRVKYSYPVSNSWTVYSDSESNRTLTAYAVCADINTAPPSTDRSITVRANGRNGHMTYNSTSLYAPGISGFTVPNGTVVTVTAVSDVPGSFMNWSGGTCSGTNPTCTFTADADKAVTANFQP